MTVKRAASEPRRVLSNNSNTPRRTRASGVVVGHDRDAGDTAVFEGGFRDHRGFWSWSGGEWEGRAGKLYKEVAS